MENSIIIELLQNTGLLLAFTMLYGNFWLKKKNNKTIGTHILSGLILSSIGVVLIYTPWHWMPGIVFDTRSVMISISGLFFGPVPTFITMITTSIVRFSIGGDGKWMGISVIILSGIIGLLWRKYRPNWRNNKYIWELTSMGIVVHISMAICTVLLPAEEIIPTLKTIAIPLICIYIPATVLLGLLMLKQLHNWQNRLAQTKLVALEKRLLKILESGNIVSIQLNTEGIVIYCNKYLTQITGYSKEEIIGKSWFDLLISKEDQKIVKQAFYSGTPPHNLVENFENKIISKKGEPIYISWHNTQFKSASNKIDIACIGVNITSTKEYETRLREKNDEIEIQNIEYKLINEKLIEAKEKAEQSELLKSAFLSNMSHEIRTPMNGILGFAELLQEPDLPPPTQLQYIKIIENSGKRLLNIINDVIDVSKIESGLMLINIKECNLNEQMNYIYEFFKPEVEAKGLSFCMKNKLPDDQAIIRTDCEKLYAILTNLVKNALKYTDAGSIEITYEPTMTDGIASVIISIKDTGIGISPQSQKTIFERFIQAEGNKKMALQGAGLGLSITKSYVEMMGGKIWVESEKNKGATFYFSLPHKHINS